MSSLNILNNLSSSIGGGANDFARCYCEAKCKNPKRGRVYWEATNVKNQCRLSNEGVGNRKQKNVRLLFITLIFFFSLIFMLGLVQAQIWISPADPVINGNNYVFITYNNSTLNNTPVLINITNPNSVLKRECNIVLNEYGYGRCKYNFTSADVSGTWGYAINTSVSGTFEVGKITINVSDKNSLSSIKYGQKTTIQVNMTYENVMPKEIVARGVGRDFGTHMGRSDFIDIDGDGDKEIVVNDYTGFIWIWENVSRFYNEGIMLISGIDWRSTDVGLYHLSSGCVYEDFDSDGVQTMICGEHSLAQLRAWVNVNLTQPRDVAPTFTSPDEGDTIRTSPVLCDVNNDSIADQVAVGIYQGYIVFYNFTDTGGFTQIYKSGDLGTMDYGTRPLCADFDNDGYNEWIVEEANYGHWFYDVNLSNISQIILGDKAPDGGYYYGYGVATDFDNDGKIEAIFPMSHGRLQILEYNKSGTNELEEDLVIDTDTDWGSYAYGGGFLEIDDMNKNGRPDFIHTDTETQSIFTEYDPDTTDWYQIEVGDGFENSYNKPAYVDFDGDGIKEVLIFSRYSGNTYIYKFNGEKWDLIYNGWVKKYGEDGFLKSDIGRILMKTNLEHSTTNQTPPITHAARNNFIYI